MGIQKISSSSIWIIGIVSGLIIGLALGYFYIQPELQSTQKSETDLKAQVADMEFQVSELFDILVQSERNLMDAQAESRNLRVLLSDETLEKDRMQTLLAISNSTLTATLLDLGAKKIALKEAVEEARIQSDQYAILSNQQILSERYINQLDAGKKLLIEFRKEINFTRTGVQEYWAAIKELAVDIDPSLGRNVDKILDSIDIYFDWVENDPGFDASFEEVAIWLLIPPEGVANYGSSIDDFMNEVYLKIIRDIDAAIEAAG